MSLHLPRGVLVYGLGRSGSATLELLTNQLVHAVYFDAKPTGPDIQRADAAGVRRVSAAELEGDLTDTLREYSLCIAAPGVPIDNPHLQALRAAGIPVIGEVEWVWRTVPGCYVGITGTAGKGTVTRWTTDVLVGAGVKAVAGGNIDPALAQVALLGATHVVEMSSFQLERVADFAPDVAVVLNLGEDHLDRHGDVEAYHAAKHRLIENLTERSTLVLNLDDPKVAAWASGSEANVRGYSLTRPAAAHLRQDGYLYLDDEPVIHRSELQVRGDHQVSNALAVALAVQAMGAGDDALAQGLRDFAGLPGRYASVGNVGNIEFIEDSIATRPLAVAAALRSTPRPLVWLAGGQDKGADLGSLRELVKERVDLLIAYGASAQLLAATYSDCTQVQVVTEPKGEAALAQAVDLAVEHLSTFHGGAGTVLLAPLAASFDQFKDYAHRAKVFRAQVARLKAESVA
ncbi:MAG: UDP-N-acetylmuramoyl-L-alanine--D-glutamate ligase [Trueperaceae bacterium]|nr:UDP-N-acetylmuramoyl-L-alanine--D-glutamate ligase [Trueperaceae bacterium]